MPEKFRNGELIIVIGYIYRIYIYRIYWQQYDCQMVNTESPLWTEKVKLDLTRSNFKAFTCCTDIQRHRYTGWWF